MIKSFELFNLDKKAILLHGVYLMMIPVIGILCLLVE